MAFIHFLGISLALAASGIAQTETEADVLRVDPDQFPLTEFCLGCDGKDSTWKAVLDNAIGFNVWDQKSEAKGFIRPDPLDPERQVLGFENVSGNAANWIMLRGRRGNLRVREGNSYRVAVEYMTVAAETKPSIRLHFYPHEGEIPEISEGAVTGMGPWRRVVSKDLEFHGFLEGTDGEWAEATGLLTVNSGLGLFAVNLRADSQGPVMFRRIAVTEIGPGADDVVPEGGESGAVDRFAFQPVPIAPDFVGPTFEAIPEPFTDAVLEIDAASLAFFRGAKECPECQPQGESPRDFLLTNWVEGAAAMMERVGESESQYALALINLDGHGAGMWEYRSDSRKPLKSGRRYRIEIVHMQRGMAKLHLSMFPDIGLRYQSKVLASEGFAKPKTDGGEISVNALGPSDEWMRSTLDFVIQGAVPVLRFRVLNLEAGFDAVLYIRGIRVLRGPVGE